uniref:3CxxC-type domain-containing protein n=1 Tax=Esox lucius TaxID=8010 RepID=A0A3P8X9Q9_ESOLU
MSTDWTPSQWLDCFEDMVEEDLDRSDKWTLHFNYSLTETLSKEERRRGWKIHSHCAYGQFQCVDCSKTWGSARVVLVFRYRLRDETARGTVLMRPFGQACRRCREGVLNFLALPKTRWRRHFCGCLERLRRTVMGRKKRKMRKMRRKDQKDQKRSGQSLTRKLCVKPVDWASVVMRVKG